MLQSFVTDSFSSKLGSEMRSKTVAIPDIWKGKK